MPSCDPALFSSALQFSTHSRGQRSIVKLFERAETTVAAPSHTELAASLECDRELLAHFRCFGENEEGPRIQWKPDFAA